MQRSAGGCFFCSGKDKASKGRGLYQPELPGQGQEQGFVPPTKLQEFICSRFLKVMMLPNAGTV